MKTGVIWLLLALMCASASAQSNDQETIYWYLNEFPPWNILAGQYQGTGIGDRIRDSLIRRLPQFRHELVVSSHTRMLNDMKIKPNVCYLPMLKTAERELTIVFSRPLWKSPMPTNGLITTRDRWKMFSPYLNGQHELRLDEFLKTGKYRVGITEKRSYGNWIDPILKAYPSAAVAVPSGDSFVSRFAKLVNQDEFDGVIGYTVELKWGARQLGFDEKDFVFIPVEGVKADFSHVGCSRSAAGTRIISQVDKIIEDEAFQQEVLAGVRAWLPEDTGPQAAGAGKPAQSAR